MADIVLNQLYRFTALQSTFGINNVCLTGGRPEIMNLKDLIQAFIAFREEVVTRRTKFLLTKSRDRAHGGAGIGLATGAALTERIRRRGAVSVAFFGDGGANQGILLEALNLAAVWSLPLLLICENNGWSEFTATERLTARPSAWLIPLPRNRSATMSAARQQPRRANSSAPTGSAASPTSIP